MADDATIGAGETAAPDGATGPVPPGAAHRRRLARSTLFFSLATGLSRVLGLVREMVAAYYFGAAGAINSFTVAFQLPNLVRALVADAALSSAFVPVFSDLLEKGERKRAWRVASSIFWLMLLGLGGLTALFILAAPLLMRPFHPVDLDLAVTLSRILFPIVALLGVSGVVVGILNSYEEFSIPALTPVAWNLAIILGLVLGVPRADTTDGKLYVYAGVDPRRDARAGAAAASVAARPGRPAAARDRLARPGGWQTFKLMIPVTLGLGLINVNALIDTFFASRFIDPSLAPTAIDKAFRVYMLPQGMFSVAVATVLFPSLARLASRGDMAGFRDTVSRRPSPDRLPARPGERRSARSSRSRSSGCSTSAASSRRTRRTVVAGAPRGIQPRPHVQRDDADAEPRVLQPPVELDPDPRRTRGTSA